MNPLKPFEGADFDRLSISNMEALDVSKMIESLANYQSQYILSSNPEETGQQIRDDWDNLAMAALDVAENDEDIMRISNFSRMGSEAKMKAEKMLDKQQAA